MSKLLLILGIVTVNNCCIRVSLDVVIGVNVKGLPEKIDLMYLMEFQVQLFPYVQVVYVPLLSFFNVFISNLKLCMSNDNSAIFSTMSLSTSFDIFATFNISLCMDPKSKVGALGAVVIIVGVLLSSISNGILPVGTVSVI